MLRVTNAILLVGLLLAGTMLVPYDLASRNLAPTAFTAAPAQAGTLLQAPPGRIVMEFPDHWNGSMSATLYNAKVYLPQTIGLNPGMVELRLPAGMTVYPGSRWLNISLQARNAPANAQFDFEYVSADDRRGVRALSNLGTYALRLEEAMNDWSPDTFTRWRFLVYNHAMEGVEATIKIEVARESAILPGHVFVADRWSAENARVVYDRKDTLRQSTVWRQSVPIPDERAPARSAQLRGVPALDLGELQVHLYYNSSTAANLHYRPLLSFNSPRGDSYSNDRLNMPPTAEQRAASGHFLWRIPVQPEMYDTPLGSRSRWEIRVDWHGNSTDVQEYHMEGDYHFTIIALRSVLAEPQARPD